MWGDREACSRLASCRPSLEDAGCRIPNELRMSDPRTLEVYAGRAAELAACHRQFVPARLYSLVDAFFHPGAPTADLGCGSGRDTAHLHAQGYPVVGLDASAEMLREARSAYAGLDFRHASLPDLGEIPDEAFANLLCSAVLMHLRREDLITAVLALARVLQPGGRLILSYRGGRDGVEREADGRLFTPLHRGRLILLLEAAGFQLCHRASYPDDTRPEITWQVLVAEKNGEHAARGLDRVQSILAQDRKVATYKLALIRALCEIARTESHLVRWEGEVVRVPLWSIAVRWLTYYWPLLTAPRFVAQIRGETEASRKPIKFRAALRQVAETATRGGLPEILRGLEEDPGRFADLIGTIAHAVREGPVRYAGSGASPVFRYEKPSRAEAHAGERTALGWVVVPETVWLDLTRFDHWIVDSVMLRWAHLTVAMNPAFTVGDALHLLGDSLQSPRDTGEVTGLLLGALTSLRCVWTGQTLGARWDVDHAIPYSVWGNNDLWNLLPAHPAVNNRKSDRLPSPRLIVARAAEVGEYWRLYREARGERFSLQIERALGCDPRRPGWEGAGVAGLVETVQKLAMTRGLPFWEP